MTTLPEALADEIERKIAGKVSPDHFYALPLGGPQWTMILAALRSAPVPSVATLQRLIATSFDAPTPEVWREALVAAKTVRNHIEGTTPAETAPHPAGGDGIVERLPGWHPTERGLMRRHPRGSWTGRDDAEKTVARKDAEIERLQAQVATVRSEALEEAANVVAGRGPASQDMTSTMICEALDDAAAAIRALKENDR